jgi:putative transposase
LRDARDFERHMDDIYFNPVKHGHTLRAADWPHSSFHRMVRLGIYPPDWAGNANDAVDNFGER